MADRIRRLNLNGVFVRASLRRQGPGGDKKIGGADHGWSARSGGFWTPRLHGWLDIEDHSRKLDPFLYCDARVLTAISSLWQEARPSATERS